MSRKPSEHLKQAILEAVENQLRDNKPPETRLTLERLQNQGFPREEAVRLIGCVLSTEIFEIMKSKLHFNPERYADNLNKLPVLPCE